MKIDFEYETEYGKFEDALWLPSDEPTPSPEEIEAMKLERLNSWLEIVMNPPESELEHLPEPEPLYPQE